jgi:8-oxo-dGTP diphosphatase
MLVNGSPDTAMELGADGVHLPSKDLMACSERPLDRGHWVAASCHGRHEVDHACSIGVDFIVVSPVKPTLSHPGAPVLGWRGLRALTAGACVPVYALGGMTPSDLETAWAHGAQGIAAIRGLWNATRGQ